MFLHCNVESLFLIEAKCWFQNEKSYIRIDLLGEMTEKLKSLHETENYVK